MNQLSPPQTKRSLVGTRLFGDYTIVRQLGEGGMGAVYLARQEAIQQEIAIKVLHARAAESQEIVERFNREARVISVLTHPNIIRVFIFGRTENDLMYLAMEYVKGRELREELRQLGALDELKAIKIMKQVCSAVQEAHDLSIVHRDLKPDNILLTAFRGEPDFVKILDFGIAKITDNQNQEKQLTQAGIVYGTPEYLSPEQAQAKPLDHRTDLYSMGIILYELVTGRVPFDSNSAVQTLTMHVFEQPEPPSKIARVAPTMERIIMKALMKDPKDRFQSAMEFFRALEARERELLEERRLGSDSSYVPGGELTGMFQAVGSEAPATGGGPGRGAHPAPQPGFGDTSDVRAPGLTQAGAAPADPSRKIALIVIALCLVILIVLGIVAVSLLLSK